MHHRDAFGQPDMIPTTRQELDQLGWKQLDVVLVSGDTLVDSPSIGVSVIARVLLNAGYRTGLIAQPDLDSDRDIGRLGEPRLFWGISAGSFDSMVANYTASGKPRRRDDLTPGGQNRHRPDRACIVYTQLVRRYFKATRPIVLGGIEASLRRISHYDAWTDSVRRSILFDAKADLLVYGMGETTVLTLAEKLRCQQEVQTIRGLCFISRQIPEQGIELPSHEAVSNDNVAFEKMFVVFARQSDPRFAKRLYQKQDTRYVVQNPPALPLTPHELDDINELPYTRKVHPFYSRQGPTTGLETIAFSMTSHRGCYGQCRFCAIGAHQGKIIISRSQASLLREAAALTRHDGFKGIIMDVGGPTANMYGTACGRKNPQDECLRQGCLTPTPCRHLCADHRSQIALLQALRQLPAIRKVFIASGIRYDLIVRDSAFGMAYLEEIMTHHISGQMKIAPEHSESAVLQLMGKPQISILEDFLVMFNRINRKLPKKVFLTYYLMAAHPGCTLADMQRLRTYALQHWKILPEQVQIFTPTPATISTTMYHTGRDPWRGETLFVEKSVHGKQKQKAAVAN
jgi:uncharacterized radical SAM protein YgiQ